MSGEGRGILTSSPTSVVTVEGVRLPEGGQRWWTSSSMKIYTCHIFSSWGDRMWGFAVGLYMVILFPDSLLLTAIYGFCNCLSGIILGPYIGGWIDKTQRITAARASVVVQNSAVVLGSTILTVTLFYRSQIQGVWNGRLEHVLFAVIITVAIVAELASVANKIALEKDWIVVLAGGDNKQLAKLNSTMRTINLTTSILAPIVVGQIITYGSPEAGAIFIAAWNIVSAVIEYSLLLHIYKIVPELGTKDDGSSVVSSPPFVKMTSSPEVISPSNNNVQQHLRVSSGGQQRLSVSPGMAGFEDVSLVTPTTLGTFNLDGGDAKKKGGAARATPCLPCHVGWRNYFGHHVKFAGLGLACLYMTVLGFDSITTGFMYSQGVDESFIGILTAIGAIFGILGSVSFPLLRKHLGKNSTGILGFILETAALLLCVGSVFALGSPFKPEAIVDRFQHFSGAPSSSYFTRMTYSIKEIWEREVHIVILLGGIIVARFGLWVADLSVTQIFQEEVEESQRGVINGVQDSLNKGMDLIKFVLVILLPAPETFGYLIFISWLSVFLGSVSFFIFTRKDKIRNGLFGVDNLVIVDSENNSPPRELQTFAPTFPATPEKESQSRRDSDHLIVKRTPVITVSQTS